MTGADRNFPNWQFDDATLERAAVGFDNPDYVDVVLHSYRHRLGLAPSYPPYEQIEKKLTAHPPITVPAFTLDGLADGNFPRVATTGLTGRPSQQDNSGNASRAKARSGPGPATARL
jgi:hypothetical protein